MKIAIDLQSCQTDSRDRGIGRYSLSLAATLAESRTDTILAMLDAGDTTRLREARHRLRDRQASLQTLVFQHPRGSLDSSEVAGAFTSDGAALLKSRLIASLGPDVYVCTSFFEGFDGGRGTDARISWDALGGVPTAVIAYDLIPMIFSDRYLKPNPRYRRWYESKLDEFVRFDHFFAISEATKKDLVGYLKVDPDRISVVGAGVDDVFLSQDASNRRGSDAHFLTSLGIRDPFVLTVGNADWRKNSMGALDAFALLPKTVRKKYKLVLTQAGDDVRHALSGKHRVISDRVMILGKVDDDQLSVLYRACEAMLFPSFYEGFGLPIVEAMAHGAPVVSSSRGSLSEIGFDGALNYDPDKPREAAQLLELVLMDGTLRQKLSAQGIAHSKQFTWQRCASSLRQVVDAIEGKGSSEEGDWTVSELDVITLANAVQVAGMPGLAQLRGALSSISQQCRRRLLVDVTVTSITSVRTGIQRVVRNYCTELLELAASNPQIEVVPIQCDDEGTRYAWSFARDVLGFNVEFPDSEVEALPNDLLFLLDSTWENPSRFDDLVHAVWREGGEVVRMVYDLVPILVPQTCHPGMPPVFRAWLRHAVNLTDGLICISEAVRLDLESFMDDELAPDAPRPWTRAVHLGCDLDAQRDATGADSSQGQAVLEALQGCLYLVAVGTIEPRKDHATILDAVEQVWAEGGDIALVLVGKQGWNVDALAARLREHAQRGRRLFWLEQAGDGDLQLLLSKAVALVQASLSEGFGLPIVEAGSQGVPLILSDLPVFREVAGDEATYFRVGDAVDLADVMHRGLEAGGWPHPHGIRALTWAQSTQALRDVLFPYLSARPLSSEQVAR